MHLDNFVWPKRMDQTDENPGAVYEVAHLLLDKWVVVLPDKTFLEMTWLADQRFGPYLSITELPDFNSMEFDGPVFAATKVFGLQDPSPVFDGSAAQTPTLVWKINAAAAVNELFVVFLTKEAYDSLLDGGLDDLKEHLSERANSLIRLCDESNIDFDHEGVPALDLYRTGRCP